MENFPHSSMTQTLSPEENQRLLELCAKGDLAARERIIVAYFPKIIKHCRKYEGKGVPFDDLFQEGSYGLILALDRYDPSLNTNFATYATTYIEKHIKKALITQNSFQPVVYEEDYFYEIQKYLRTLDDLKEQLQRTPSDSEVASALKITENKIRKLSQSLYTFLPVEDLCPDPVTGVTPYQTSSTEAAALNHVLDLSSLKITLNARENEVISRRMGFTDSGIPESTAEISAALGISWETVRRAYEQAMAKIRDAVNRYGYTLDTIEI